MADVRELRLNPFLVSRRGADQGVFTCEDPLGNKDFQLEGGSFAEIFAALRGVTGFEEVVSVLCKRLDLDRETAKTLVNEMIASGVLVDGQDPKVKNAIASKKLFDRYGWSSAFYFHNAVRDYPFLDYALPEGRAPDYEQMRKYLAVKGLPDKYKLYEGVTPLLLEKTPQDFRFDASFEDLFRYEQEAECRPLTWQRFSHLMYLTMGQIGKKPWPDQGYLVRRTSPSGGARHPTEAYIAVFQLENIPAGVYHYNTRDHGLDPLRAVEASALRQEVRAAAPDVQSRLGFEPKAVLFFTTIPERSMWRYRESRSFRVLFIDLGHILATFRMVCCGMHLRYFTGQGVRDNDAERLIGVDGTNESVLYMAALG